MGEDLRQLRVQVDHHVLFGFHQLIPLFHLLFYPFPEWIADDGVDHVAEPWLGHLVDLSFVRQVLEDLWVIFEELADLDEGQLLVLRDLDPCHLLTFDV